MTTTASSFGAARVLLVDDEPLILDELTRVIPPVYGLHTARQGLEGVEAHALAVAADQPFALAFVDVEMPPGIDGIETAARMWQVQPDLEVVLCTSDFSWHGILDRLSRRDQLVILRKPFEPIEVRQIATCLTEKWRRGREFTARLKELELRVSDEVARRLDVEVRHAQKFEALGRLSAAISHEINTPTQYIQGSLEFLDTALRELGDLVAKDSPDLPLLRAMLAELPGAVADASEGVRRVTKIVRSVREYAHTRRTAEAELVDLDDQIRLIVELARAQYKHDADITLDLGGVPCVLGDADALARAMLNLIVNAGQAIQAARPRSTGARGTIAIRTRATDTDVILEVRDTGVGIPRELHSRVFQPFFTTKARGEGTGQGLTMARATIVDVHHGTLTFDSEVGVGTTFRITLPRTKNAEIAA